MVKVTDKEIIIESKRLKLQIKTQLWLPSTKKKFTQLLNMMEDYAGITNLKFELEFLITQIDKMIDDLIEEHADPALIKKMGSRRDQLYTFIEQWRLFNGA